MSYNKNFRPDLGETLDVGRPELDIVRRLGMDTVGEPVASTRKVWAAVWFGNKTLNSMDGIPVMAIALPHRKPLNVENVEWYWGTVFPDVLHPDVDSLGVMADHATRMAETPMLALSALKERLGSGAQKVDPNWALIGHTRRTQPYADVT